MSEPKLISPMLDNFVMGDPISEHNGVRCCPAINKETDEKYIVKIISVPASQTQVDALLLSGAFSDKDAALSYFKTIADGIVDEKNILDELSRLEGYSAIEGCQIVPMEDECGFDVYLLSSYRSTLRHYLRRNCMTHLQALNLGLDLCAALSVARRMGYLYVDLKPENIYINGTQEFRIGDLGFVNLNSLQYTSLPDRYRSSYTAPEISDAYSDLNKTIDVFALGLILYQVFNDGQLPESFISMTAPAYADYEMTEIIQKACAVNPDDRWQDPAEMGQALVNYMQRNGAHDTPIVPLSNADDIPDVVSEDDTEGLYEEHSPSEDEAVVENSNSEPADSIEPSDESEYNSEVVEDAPIAEEEIFHEDSDGNLTLIETADDETTQAQDGAEVEYDEVSNEITDMLLQADELIAHEAPAPVVQPEPIDVPIPEPITPEETEPAEADDDAPSEEAQDSVSDDQDNDTPVVEESEFTDAEDEEDDSEPSNHKNRYTWLIWLAVVIMAGALALAAFWGYKNYYIQNIDSLTLTLTDGGTLTVKITTTANDSDLVVTCTDTYGNARKSAVTDGTATFTGLIADTPYYINVSINGFHKLTGKTTDAFSTPAETEVTQLEAITGKISGNVILNFSVNGPDPEHWNVSYKAPDGTVGNLIFSGHTVTVKGLQVGKEYDFTITPTSEINVIGTNTLKYLVRPVVRAEDLEITGCYDNKIFVSWSVAEETSAEEWTVRCYNDAFETVINVKDCSAEIEIPDTSAEYTIEVTANDMSVNSSIRLPQNSATVTSFNVDESVPGSITVNWTLGGAAPEGGLILSYTVDGFGPTHLPIPEGTSATIENVVPGGTYTFEFTTAKGAPVFKGEYTHTTADAEKFESLDDLEVDADDLVFYMCLDPEDVDWRDLIPRSGIEESDEITLSTEYKATDKISFIIDIVGSYEDVDIDTAVLYIIRNSEGDVCNISAATYFWPDMTQEGYIKLDLPTIPAEPGSYTISTYFNNGFVDTTSFTIVE